MWVINIIESTVQVPPVPLNREKRLSRQEYEWRKILLAQVQRFWIDGVLTNCLHTQVSIKLGFEDRSDYVFSSVEGFKEFSLGSRQVFTPGTSASDIFEGIGTGRTLLILGEPGAGKTITLLKLAESLIKRTENDLSQPLPVVVNLSSWARQRKSISDWLTQELDDTYRISKSLGKTWIKEEQLILLLDGLDEVATQYRSACVSALNQFLQAHEHTEMVVCCRVHEYKSLSERLRLRSAIFVKPLTSQQIDLYLNKAGESLRVLKTVLNHNTEIKAFASSPLILSIMSLADQDCSLDTFQPIKTPDIFYQHLFNAYIKRMLTRRGTSQLFSSEKTKHWLSWMAQRMAQTSQTVFLIEQMQPSYLQNWFQRIRYRFESGLVSGLISGLIFGLIHRLQQMWGLGFYQDFFNIIFFGLIHGIFIGLIVVFLVVLW